MVSCCVLLAGGAFWLASHSGWPTPWLARSRAVPLPNSFWHAPGLAAARSAWPALGLATVPLQALPGPLRCWPLFLCLIRFGRPVCCPAPWLAAVPLPDSFGHARGLAAARSAWLAPWLASIPLPDSFWLASWLGAVPLLVLLGPLPGWPLSDSFWFALGLAAVQLPILPCPLFGFRCSVA